MVKDSCLIETADAKMITIIYVKSFKYFWLKLVSSVSLNFKNFKVIVILKAARIKQAATFLICPSSRALRAENTPLASQM